MVFVNINRLRVLSWCATLWPPCISGAHVVLCRGEQKRMASSMLAMEAQCTKTIGCETFEMSVDSSN